MNELFFKYITNQISAEEKKLLFNALKNDEEMKREFAGIQNLWACYSLASNNNPQLAINKLQEFNRLKNKCVWASFFKRSMRYAALIAFAVIATYTTLYFTSSFSNRQEASLYQEVSVPAGQRTLLKLNDGTTVWLNSNSTLRYPAGYNHKNRHVILDGEAYFDVAKDKKHPFIVETEKQNIRVLGTSFNVFAYRKHEEFNVSLLSGSVQIYNRGNEQDCITLQPHEQVQLTNGKLVKAPITNTDFLLWKKGVYTFDNLPLSKIIQQLELFYDVKIITGNEKLKAFRYTGKFRQRDGIENVFQQLQLVYPFTYSKNETNNSITLY